MQPPAGVLGWRLCLTARVTENAGTLTQMQDRENVGSNRRRLKNAGTNQQGTLLISRTLQ